ncbi:MAG: tetratricopeptide repeat protein [Bacteriovoracaceae bacterium]|nr:tetratricopeptide repeat protein [Bacteriovoracaceae bacterium]
MNKEILSSPLLIKYQKVYEQDPTSRVFAPLSEGYRKLGMVEKAMEILKRGIQHNPDYVTGLLCLAKCYFDIDEHDKAYEILQPIVDDNIDNIALQTLFGEVCRSIGKFNQALDTYKYLLFLNPRKKEYALQVKELEDSGLCQQSPDQQNKSVSSFSDISSYEIKSFDTESLSTSPYGQQENQEPDLVQKHDIAQEQDTNQLQEQQLKMWLDLDKKPKEQTDQDIVQTDDLDELPEPKPESELLHEESDLPQEPEAVTVATHEVNEDPQEAPPPSSKNDMPVITHTLVDLYCAQGYYKKAIEILKKILELNPDDDKTKKKLEDVAKLINSDLKPDPTVATQQETQTDGHSDLMQLFDSRLGTQQAERFKMAEQKMYSFLNAIRERADTLRTR